LIEAEAMATKSGIKKINEARRRLDLGPITGGDTAYLQEQNYSLEALAKRDARADPFAKGETEAPAPDPAAEAAQARAAVALYEKDLREALDA